MIVEKSRKYLLAAIALLFFSQFFQYDSDWFTPGWYSYSSGYYYGGYYHYGETGWQYHGWAGAGLIGAAAYYFYKSQRKIRDYYIVLPIIVLLGFGGSTGGTLGFFAMLIAGYATYTRWKEVKAEKAATLPQQNTTTTTSVHSDAINP